MISPRRPLHRREDVLDTSIGLRHPSDYALEQGARFEVHIDKGRGIHGEHAKPFEASLEIAGQSAVWTMKEIEDLDRQRVAALLATGLARYRRGAGPLQVGCAPAQAEDR